MKAALETAMLVSVISSVFLILLGSGAIPYTANALFFADNLPPDTVVPSINTSLGTNAPGDAVNCYAVITDPNSDRMNVSFRWYRNGTLQYTVGYLSYLSGSFVKSAYIATKDGDVIKCSIRTFDGLAYSEWAESAELRISGVNPTCSDGTAYYSCSAAKPKYCTSGVLRDLCAICGCPTGYSCNYSNNACYVAGETPVQQSCTDGTLYSQCSITKPKYCDNGVLADRCVLCGCPAGYSCNSTSSKCYVPATTVPPTEPSNNLTVVAVCTDNTEYNQCSITKPKYCDNGTLIDKCAACNCPLGYLCNSTTNACYASSDQPIPGVCSDGTAYSECSATKPLYCSAGNLVNDCMTCGCASGYSCSSSGACLQVAASQPLYITKLNALEEQSPIETPTETIGGNYSAEQAAVSAYLVEFSDEPVIAKYSENQYEIREFMDQAEDLEDSAETALGLKREMYLTTADYLNALVAKKQKEERSFVNEYRDEVNANQITALQDIVKRTTGLKVLQKYSGVFNGALINLSERDLQRAENSPYVKSIQPDVEVTAMLTQSVPITGAPTVWAMTDPTGQSVTGKGVTIAIIDTGIDYTHPDLGGCFGPSCKVIGGWDFYNDDADPKDDNMHGTHCAGIAAANGAMKGMAPDAKLYAYKVLGAGGSGSMGDVLLGIERAMDPNQDGDYSDHVDVISMSLGGPGTPDDSLSTGVQRAVDAGVVVVAAAGNSGPMFGSATSSPGIAPYAITVGAVDKNGTLAYFSSRGTGSLSSMKPELSAPGVSITSTLPGGKYGALSGTSMATPHVAGAAALLIQLHPDWTPMQVKSALITGASPIADSFWRAGSGQINVPASASTSVFFSKPLVAFGTYTNPAQTISVSGQPGTYSISSTDWNSLSLDGWAGAVVNISYNAAVAEPSPISIAQDSSSQLSLSIPSSNVGDGLSDGYILLNGPQAVRLPFGYANAATLAVHALDMDDEEIYDPYGVVVIFSVPTENIAALKIGGSTSAYAPPAEFILPKGNYSIYAMGHKLIYSFSSPYVLHDTVTISEAGVTDVYLKMSEARQTAINLTTLDGLPIVASEYRAYFRHKGLLRNISYDVEGSDYKDPISYQSLSFFASPLFSRNLYLSDTPDTIGVSISGYAYSPAMHEFISYNRNHWYSTPLAVSALPFSMYALPATADQEYLLSWEFKGGVNSSLPKDLTLKPGEYSTNKIKYDIPGKIVNPWLYWGNSLAMGTTANFWARVDTQASAYPFFSGMTRTTFVQGVFMGIYTPLYILDGTIVQRHYVPNWDSLSGVSDLPNLFIVNRQSLSPKPIAITEETHGSRIAYPSVYTNNTLSQIKLYHPILSGENGTKKILSHAVSAQLFRSAITSAIGYYSLPEASAWLDGVRSIDVSPTGLYILQINLYPYNPTQLIDNMTINLGMKIGSSDSNAPRILDFNMPAKFVPGEKVIVQFNAVDYQSQMSASLRWRNTGTSAWAAVPVTVTGSKFSAEISTVSSSAGIDILLNLTDSSGNYLEFTSRNASVAQIPIIFELDNPQAVEYVNQYVTVPITGKLTNAAGGPLHPQGTVSLDIMRDKTKIAMILDEYITDSGYHVHNGSIRFPWTLNPAKIFTGPDQTVTLNVNLNLGTYQPINRTIVLRSTQSVLQLCADGTPYGQCLAEQPKYCDNGNIIDKCAICGCAESLICTDAGTCVANSAPSVATPALKSVDGSNSIYSALNCTSQVFDENGDLLNATLLFYKNNVGFISYAYKNILSGSKVQYAYPPFIANSVPGDVWKCAVRAYDGRDYSAWIESNTVTLLPTSTQTCSDGTIYGACSITKPKYCDSGTLVNKCTVCGCTTGYLCNSTTNACYIPNAVPSLSQVGLVSLLGTNTTDEDLSCFGTASDADGSATNITVTWYKGGVTQLINRINNVPAGGSFSAILKSGNTSAGETWQCSAKAFDGLAYSSTVQSNTLLVIAAPGVNNPPLTPAPQISSSLGTNTTSEDLNCYEQLVDLDGDKLNATVQWFRNGLLNLTKTYNQNYASESVFNALLESNNLTLGDKWGCSIKLYDGKVYSQTGYSGNLTIIAPAPPAEVPAAPAVPAPTVSTGGGGGGGGGGGVPVAVTSGDTPAAQALAPCINSLEVAPPNNIEVVRGRTKTVVIGIKNTGSCAIDSVQLTATVPSGWFTVSTVLQDTLEVNESAIVPMGILVPQDTPGEYSVSFSADATNATATKSIRASLLENPELLQAETEMQQRAEAENKISLAGYIVALLLIEFVCGVPIIMLWTRKRP